VVAENLIINASPNPEEEPMSKIAFAAVLLAVPLCAAAQTWKVPAESQRCPSKWGEVIELAHVLGSQMAFSGPAASTCTPSAPS